MGITIAEQIHELERELAMRCHLYPQWVDEGTLKSKVAQERIGRLKEAIRTLRFAHSIITWCAENHPAPREQQGSLFETQRGINELD